MAGPTGPILKEALKQGAKAGAKGAQVTRPPAEPRILSRDIPEQIDELAEAQGLMNAELKQFDQGQTEQLNFDMIATSDELKATLGSIAEKNKAAINAERRETIHHEQLKGLAEDLQLDVDVIVPIMERNLGDLVNAETILAGRQVLNQSAKRLRSLAQKVTSGEATDFDKLAFRRQFTWHEEFQMHLMGARAEIGRALGSFNIPVGTDTMQLGRLTELSEAVGKGDVQAMAQMINAADSVAGIGKVTREFNKARTFGVLQELFINSILSGIKTHAVNTTGNVFFAGMNIAEHAVAARIGRYLPGDDHVMIGEAQAMMYGAISGWKDALRVFGQVVRTGESGASPIAKFETVYRKAISAENLGIESRLLAPAVDFLGSVIRAPTERMLMAEDEFAKIMLYREFIAQQAYREAARKLEAGAIDDVAEFIRHYMENPPAGVVERAQDWTLYGTFQNPLGPRGQHIQAMVNNSPAKFIAPFIKTPTNLFKAGFVERSPLGLFSRRIREQIAQGGPQRDLALARLSMGTLTVGVIAAAAGGGFISGGGPSNHQARKLLEATGWKPYSVRVVNPVTGEATWQSYARIEPLAFIIGATADAVEILAHADFDDELTPEEEIANQMIAAVVAGMAENTMSKTFLSGVADFIQAVDDPTRYWKNYQDRFAGAFVPFSAFRRDIGRIQDPYIREAFTLAQRLRNSSGIPGWSEDAPLSLDVFGNPRKYVRGSILGPVSPWPDSRETLDPTQLALVKLMQESNLVPVTMPSRRVEGVRLTTQEYHDLVHLSRKELEIGGPGGKMNFMEFVTAVMDSKVYDQAGLDGKVTMIKDVQRAFDGAARAQLQIDSEGTATGLHERLKQHRMIRQKRKFGDLIGQ